MSYSGQIEKIVDSEDQIPLDKLPPFKTGSPLLYLASNPDLYQRIAGLFPNAVQLGYK